MQSFFCCYLATLSAPQCIASNGRMISNEKLEVNGRGLFEILSVYLLGEKSRRNCYGYFFGLKFECVTF